MSFTEDKVFSLIIPCYNEEEGILILVNRVILSLFYNK